MTLLFMFAAIAMGWRANAKCLHLVEMLEKRHPYVWMWLGHPGIFSSWQVVEVTIADSRGKAALPQPLDAEMHALAKAIRRDWMVGACLMLTSAAIGFLPK